MLPVKGFIKNYHWGRTDDNSYIAKFELKSDNSNSKNSIPLAELWFGSHPSGPSSVVIEKQYVRLDQLFKNKPDLCGSINNIKKYGCQLPYLFKILSIEQPLSLQAHPNKKLAKILHQNDPTNYPDDNHKPELAIALTDFYVLCDFRTHKEIANFMKNIKQFVAIVGDSNKREFISNADDVASLRKCFKALMTSSKEVVSQQMSKLLTDTDSLNCLSTELQRLCLKLHKLYPGDPGCFAPFFLNYLKLKPGQAIYLEANKIHAYIEGECIECMACSDNVVRAGLTSKFRDVDTLIDMLDYSSCVKFRNIIFEPVTTSLGQQSLSIFIQTFSPTEEFSVDKIVVEAQTYPSKLKLSAHKSGSFLIVVKGKALAHNFRVATTIHKLTLGSAAYIPPEVSLELFEIHDNFVSYRAYC